MPLCTGDAAVFVDAFNATVIGAARRITVEDILHLTECRLIGRYSFYGRADVDTVIGVLRFEQWAKQKWAEDRTLDDIAEDEMDRWRRCRSCGRPLQSELVQRGRPREYCRKCESKRVAERKRRSRQADVTEMQD